ncbi:ParA family protein [Magnetospirillum sp. UT-4]|uniref:ParA family protein n=1 Tax=Magnetospirillum sp. UT-4 TaxID=2681467 RepID=UPI00137F9985|nr:AAA family ATPase [Magnetospirillum sp. UT-4]CAA7619565.1 putative nucleoside triphosphate hydrolases [Magnetospirillum sp. UT-4]
MSGNPPIIAVFNAKGGVGKTTTVVNLAVCLAAFGRKVLVVDVDAQGNATTSFAKAELPRRGTYDLMTGRATLAEVMHPTFIDGVSLVGATDDLGIVDVELAVSSLQQGRLRDLIAAGGGELDIVLVDCPPAIGAMTVNALISAHAVIVPANPTPFAHDGLMRTWHIVKRFRSTLNPALFVHGVLLTLADSQQEWAMEHVMKAELGDLVYPVRVSHEPRVFVDAAGHGLPACVFAPASAGAREYLSLAEQVLLGEPRLHRTVLNLAGNPDPVPAASRQAAENALSAWHVKARDMGLLNQTINIPSLGPALPPPVFAPEATPHRTCSTWLLVAVAVTGAIFGAAAALLTMLG